MNIKLNKEIKKIKLASRNSLLARYQTSKVFDTITEKGYQEPIVKYLISSGDTCSDDLFKIHGGKGLFTKEIDQLVIKKKIDIGVHSLKDVPGIIDKNLIIGAVLEEEDARDTLVTKNMNIKKIEELPKNSSFASSSPRRIAFIKSLRPDILIKPLRGNVITRVDKIDEGYAYSTILALAGLKRLGIESKCIFPIPINKLIPSPGQGIIALIHRKDNLFAYNLCKNINNNKTSIRVSAEREFVKEIEGDCNTALGAYAEVKGSKIKFHAKLFSSNGRNYLSEIVSGPISDSKKIGKHCAQLLIKKGAKDLMTSKE